MIKFLKWILIILLLTGGIGAPIYYFWLLPPSNAILHLYEVETPIKREIKQTIAASGLLKLKDQIKIGSIVVGRVKALHVKENDVVAEGQLLVEIETGLGDTEVREAQGAYEKALAELDYQEKNYERQKQLFEEFFISEAALQESKRNYLVTLAEVKILEATYEKKKMAYQNSKVYAPTSGIVLHLDVAKGEKVSADLEGGSLLSLAPDIKCMEVELDIHERDIGQITKGQKVQMVVDTYPGKIFESTIQSVSLMAKLEKEKECIYLAKACIENPHLLLRPGMSVNAMIDVAGNASALALTSRAFMIKQEHLSPIAELLNFSLEPIEEQDKRVLLKDHLDQNIQFVWQACESCFREIPVEVGITDNIYFEIKSGLKGDENLIVDVMEKDKMQEIYEKFYRKL